MHWKRDRLCWEYLHQIVHRFRCSKMVRVSTGTEVVWNAYRRHLPNSQEICLMLSTISHANTEMALPHAPINWLGCESPMLNPRCFRTTYAKHHHRGPAFVIPHLSQPRTNSSAKPLYLSHIICRKTQRDEQHPATTLCAWRAFGRVFVIPIAVSPCRSLPVVSGGCLDARATRWPIQYAHN